MDTVRQKREEQFREVQADTTYNHHLLQEHLQAEEQITAERAEQEALLDSYRSARDGHSSAAVPHAGGGGCGRLQRGR